MAIHYQSPLDRTFHALGDGTRRQMIEMLAVRGTLSASDLGRPFDAAQATISKHIRVLETAGLVQREVQGRVHRFRLQEATMQSAEDWIARHRSFWEGTLAGLEAHLRDRDQNE